MRKFAPFYLLIAFIVASAHILCGPASSMAAAEPTAFFSQGQSAYDPQDQTKSEQLAVRDFMVHGLTQAVAKFLSPTQMATQFSDLQKKILAQPSKYIDSYQVFSENQSGGLYLVVGQISVTMDVLQKDLEDFGFPVAGAQQKKADPEPGPAVSNARPDNYDDDNQEEDAPPDDEEEPVATPVRAEPAPAAASIQQQGHPEPKPQASRGLSVTKREILWVVAEKWDQEWVLPTDKRSLFAKNIGKELDKYDISIQLPQDGSIRMDISGRIAPSQVTALAEGLGIRDAVVGTFSLRQDRNTKQAWLETNLQLIGTGDGKSDTEIHKAQSMEELSNQDGALELASRVAQQLSTLLGGKPEGSRKPETVDAEHEPRGAASSSEGSANTRWTINMPSAQYPYWKEMEGILRRQFRNMQVTSLEVGSAEGAVKIEGVEGNFISGMNGTSLPSGALIRVDSYSAESGIIKISFSPSGKGPSEPK